MEQNAVIELDSQGSMGIKEFHENGGQVTALKHQRRSYRNRQ